MAHPQGRPERASDPRWRGIAKNLALSLASLLLTLAALEGLLRLQEPFTHLVARHFDLPLFFAHHPIWDHWRTPNIHIAFPMRRLERYPELADYSFNSEGLRDFRDVTTPKVHGVKRVFVMGDSFTEGFYYRDTMSVILEHSLDHASPYHRYEVFNAGCLSYSPLLYYLRLKNQLLALEPDAIVLNLDLTDVYDDSRRYGPRCVWGPDGQPERIYRSWPDRAWTALKTDLYLGRVAATIAMRIRFHHPPEENLAEVFSYFSPALPVDSPQWQKDVDFFLDNLSRVIALCREHGVDLVVTTIPHSEQIVPDDQGHVWHQEVERRIEQRCAREGVPFFNPYPDIAAAVRAGQPIYFPDDFHFTPEGQRLWSGIVSQMLVDRWVHHRGRERHA